MRNRRFFPAEGMRGHRAETSRCIGSSFRDARPSANQYGDNLQLAKSLDARSRRIIRKGLKKIIRDEHEAYLS
jgi:hypothetical protein